MTTRREFLRAAGGGIFLYALPAPAVGAAPEILGHEVFLTETRAQRGASPKDITPNDDFFRASYSGYVPRLNWGSYALRIAGLVDRPVRLNMRDIEALTDKREYVTLECSLNPTRGGAIGTALWEGVRLRRLIEQVSPQSNARRIAFFAYDGFSASLPLSVAQSDEVFLAHRMNSQLLPLDHGYPLRLIAPGLYGLKSVKWLSMIELVDDGFMGYWARKGHRDVLMKPGTAITSLIDGASLPMGVYDVAGYATGVWRGIRSVELSLDGGRSWRQAEVPPPMSQWSWLLWRYRWEAEKPGVYRLKARSRDRTGKTYPLPVSATAPLDRMAVEPNAGSSIEVTIRKPTIARDR